MGKGVLESIGSMVIEPSNGKREEQQGPDL